MADRIVDEMNPDAHLSSKEVHSLICDEEEDPVAEDLTPHSPAFTDPVMKEIVSKYGRMLTKLPFSHESLLVDRQDNKLSKSEKKLAERAYNMEKTSKISYSRPSYAAFYPKQGTFATNLHNPGANGITRNRYYENGKRLDSWISPHGVNPAGRPIASVRPVHSDPEMGDISNQPISIPDNLLEPKNVQSFNENSNAYRINHSVLPQSTVYYPATDSVQRSNSDSAHPPTTHLNLGEPPQTVVNASSAMEALSRQGVGIEQVQVPRDLIIPTNPTEPPIHLKAGENITVIRTPKGVNLKVGEKIIKIRQQGAVSSLFGGLAAAQPSSATEESSHSDLIVKSSG